MAQSGYTPISLYYSTTAAAAPTAGNLVNGELAINITDGKLYYKDNAGVVQLIASKAAAGGVTSFSAGTTGLTPNTATSGAVTLAGTLAPTNGGTGLTSLATGSLVYGNGTSPFSTLAIGTSGQILTSNGTIPQWSNLSSAAVTTLSFGTTGLTPSTATSGAITVAGTLATTNGGTGLTSFTANRVFYASSTSVIAQSANLTFNGTQLGVGTASPAAILEIASSTTTEAFKVPNITEPANIVAGAPAATQTFYFNNGAVQYYTSNATTNWTVNFGFSSGTTLNTAMAVGDSMSCTMITTQGSTAYYNSSVQIDGTTSGVTTRWQGGTAPTSGNASGIDSYTYVIIKTAASTYTVLATQTKFA